MDRPVEDIRSAIVLLTHAILKQNSVTLGGLLHQPRHLVVVDPLMVGVTPGVVVPEAAVEVQETLSGEVDSQWEEPTMESSSSLLLPSRGWLIYRSAN